MAERERGGGSSSPSLSFSLLPSRLVVAPEVGGLIVPGEGIALKEAAGGRETLTGAGSRTLLLESGRGALAVRVLQRLVAAGSHFGQRLGQRPPPLWSLAMVIKKACSVYSEV